MDLNRDELIKTKLQANYSGLGYLWLPRTVFAADFIVSMPKVKTRHWADVTLSVKNMFGIISASRYGWPKNVLHWAGIHESILDICATVRPHFVIADAIAAMEGDGPLNGTPKWLNKILLADDPAAVVQSVEVLIAAAEFASSAYLENASDKRFEETAGRVRFHSPLVDAGLS